MTQCSEVSCLCRICDSLWQIFCLLTAILYKSLIVYLSQNQQRMKRIHYHSQWSFSNCLHSLLCKTNRHS
uniref:Uncharacterized protein n=1 Tax=Rhizophora mucronata TaxID=61149 RepID=A0A2P2K6X8_RHIMU